MATAERIPQKFSEDDYLLHDVQSELRWEYCAGDIAQMVGASRAHNRIVFNLVVAVGNQLQEKPCEGYANDMRVKIPAAGRYVYPDLAIACPPVEIEHRQGAETLLNPTVVIEVLSPSTEALDRGGKLESYIQIGSLRDYLLVSQSSAKVEQYTRTSSGEWRYLLHNDLSAPVRLDSVDCVIDLSAIYENVTFPPKLLDETDEPNA